MPSTYAHYVFGKKMLERFPQSLAETARNRRELYDIGLHGPDILFYYHPLKTNKVNSVGFGTHERPAREFLRGQRRRVCIRKILRVRLRTLWDLSAILRWIQSVIVTLKIKLRCRTYVIRKSRVNLTAIFWKSRGSSRCPQS